MTYSNRTWTPAELSEYVDPRFTIHEGDLARHMATSDLTNDGGMSLPEALGHPVTKHFSSQFLTALYRDNGVVIDLHNGHQVELLLQHTLTEEWSVFLVTLDCDSVPVMIYCCTWSN